RAAVAKECREALPWAVATGAAMVVAVTAVIGAFLFGGSGWDGHEPTIMDAYPVLAWGAPFAALVIGLAQTLPERSGDRWAWLVHRPVSRTTLFAAKVLAGILAYLLAYGAPLAAAVSWNASPGHVAAPFLVPMAWPALIDVAGGLVTYFTAVLVGMRATR